MMRRRMVFCLSLQYCCGHVYGLVSMCDCTAYIDNMSKLLVSYQNDARALAAQQGSKDKLQTLLTKKKLVEKEVNT